MRRAILALCLSWLICSASYSYFQSAAPAQGVTLAARNFLASLDGEQKKTTLLPYGAPQRVDWHFIPKAERKGLQVKLMTPAQRTAALELLRAALSELGYGKATKIMAMEQLLHELEAGKGQNIRDTERYFFTLFGEPGDDARWGLSIEGHHLSLNFVVDHGRVISSTPQVFAANPAIVMADNQSGIARGTRILEKEETLALELVNSLDDDQAKLAVLSPTAPKEIRNAGVAQPPAEPAEGIAYADLAGSQRGLLMGLIQEYCAAMPEDVATRRINRMHYDGLNSIRFAWMGATELGKGHYYKIQGPSFLIEFVNTQPDAAGNPANHIHSIFRDMHGDFALPIAETSAN